MSQHSLPHPLIADLNPEVQRQVRLLRSMLQAITVATLLLYVPAVVASNPWIALLVVTALLALEMVAWQLLNRRRHRYAAWTLLGGLWIALSAATFFGPAHGNLPFVGLALISASAGLLLSAPAAVMFALLSSLVGIVYLVSGAYGLLPASVLALTPAGEFIAAIVIFFATAGLTALASLGQKEAVATVSAAVESQARSARELERISAELEDQVVKRTEDLERRTRYLQAAAEVSRAAATNLDPLSLMQTAVDLILEKFDLYYTGVFITDPSGEWAMLQAGTGEAGQRMMARGHRIRVGSGMVGWCIANAQPRIALDVGRDAVRLATAELPETRTEAAIPLRSRGKVLGALTVQSCQSAAFGDVEITIFQSLADQLAVALDNARLFSESRQALDQSQRAYRQASGRAWREFLQAEGARSVQYRYGQVNTQSLESKDGQFLGTVSAAEADARAVENTRLKAIQTCRPAQCLIGGQPTLFLPVQNREQVIGVLRLVKASEGSGDDWADDEIDLLSAVSVQVGNALDAARLYQDTQRAAAREQVTSEVTARIRQTLDVQTVLRTAAEEIQRRLNLPEVVISLAAPDEIEPPETPTGLEIPGVAIINTPDEQAPEVHKA